MISINLMAIAVALGCDAFSVAIGVGSRGLTGRRIFRLAFHFALFQFLMPLIGLAIGSAAAGLIGEAAKWVAAAGLAIIGSRLAWEALRHHQTLTPRSDPTRGWSLVVLSVSTSVDALVAGFSLGLLGMNVLAACGIIGVIAGVMTVIGMALGATAARALGHWAEFVGGVMLVALAVVFVVGG
jgi:putative Mn2+ efflux pump MntP